ncbi:hypothetical protein GPJ56_010275 [Histomonas meleagridis]|uniref:uncharacterized protein n=1 Tax=Histomonas meleagridis TaxID=135588 RepID=UPI00355984C3|nr:hypothetical protein GPJ56_010275 [Histomonas meleagridis]KAH0797144.1 hypothetical protein GO595_011037 [Histomonas meleagridis]
MRVIPQLQNNLIKIVRCQCGLRVPSHNMIQCSRCGCYSHEECVGNPSPYICNFCHLASERIIVDKADKSISPSSIVIDRKALFSNLTSSKSIIQLCEIREHCLAAGHVTELIQHLITRLAAIDLELKTAEVQANREVYAPIKEELIKEIQQRRKEYVKCTSVLMEVLDRIENFKKKQKILPYFRDAVVEKLI